MRRGRDRGRARTLLTGATAVMLTGATALGLVSPIGAATGWSIVASPTPVGRYTGGQLYSVSCTSAKSCFAVGISSAAGENKPLAERWNGSSWSIVPAQGTGGLSVLASVSCTSATNCFAVGNNEIRSVVERWNGAKWSYMASAASYGGLQSVSCTSTTSCFAVGHTNSRKTLIERWNGTKWTAAAGTNPGGGFLNTVSCTSATFCLATGYNASFAEVWDGKTWTLLAGLNPVPGNPFLNGLSCASPTFCVAVGWLGESKPAVVVWNGSDWSLVASPTPPTFFGGTLNSVSCTSSTKCVAAGIDIYQNPDLKLTAGGSLIEQWDGKRWSVAPTPHPSTGGGTFLGVSCVEPAGCFAVGYVKPNRTLVEHS